MDAMYERGTAPMGLVELLAAVSAVGVAHGVAAGCRRSWAPFYLGDDSVMLVATAVMALVLHAPVVWLAVSGVRRNALSAALPGVVWATVVWLCALPAFVIGARPNEQAFGIAVCGIVGTALALKLRCRISVASAAVAALYAGVIIGAQLVACYTRTISE